MNDVDYYNAELPAIQAVPADAIKKPNMPINIYLSEAGELHSWVQNDKDALTAIGLDWSHVESLPARIGALRDAESRWYKERFRHEEAQQQWDQRAPDAYARRDKLVRDMRFAFRRDDALLKRVAGIADGSGDADLIQDLNDLATLGRDYLDQLSVLGVDAAALDQIATLAEEMGVLLADASAERRIGNSARVIRDQAFTRLKQLVDEIREYGQYQFFGDDVRRDGYFSRYVRSSNSSRGKSDTTQTDSTPTGA